MYVKPPRKQFQGEVFVPENYHGTAFTEQPIAQELPEEQAPAEQQSAPTGAIGAAKKEEGGLLSSLFSGFGGLHSDDILLLSLILLLSRSEKDGHGASELLPLLAILLFIG